MNLAAFMDNPCPACQFAHTEPFFELTDAPVSIGIQWPSVDGAKSCQRGDLRLSFCSACGFIWNQAFDACRLEYSQRYDNSLDYSPVFQEYAKSIARRLIGTYNIRKKQVIELGCGKGHFLTLLCEEGDNRGLGFDPSYEGVRIQSPAQITYIQDFYGPKYIHHLGDLICCRHVFEHIANPTEFLSLVRQVIGEHPSTVVYFEVPNVRFILEQLSIWDIIYEHCNYFGKESLAAIFRRCGFTVLRLEETYSGQFLSVEARIATDSNDHPPIPETLLNLQTAVTHFSEKVKTRSESWNSRLAEWNREGRRAVIWGAGAKAVSFLNSFKITDAIPYVVDINPYKQGQYLPGTGQQIVAPEFLRGLQPQIVVLMNPIYRQEVENRLHELGVAAEIQVA
jgi:SAM-dependent methyltransferase